MERKPRPLVAWGILAAVVCAAAGLLPSPALVGRLLGFEVEGRFPCEGGACGCTSALACWSSCCCLRPDEQLAWARAAGVTPMAPFFERNPALAGEAASCCRAGGEGDPGRDDPGDGCEAVARDAAPIAAPCLALGSPLKCKGVPLWIVFATIPGLPSAGAITLPPSRPVALLPRPGSDRTPRSGRPDVATPPPRSRPR
jgi:hypothetical protein